MSIAKTFDDLAEEVTKFELMDKGYAFVLAFGGFYRNNRSFIASLTIEGIETYYGNWSASESEYRTMMEEVHHTIFRFLKLVDTYIELKGY
jgi:hypothetical protein